MQSYTVRLDYDGTIGEVGEVLIELQRRLREDGQGEATVFASARHIVEMNDEWQSGSAKGVAVLEVEATDRLAAHERVQNAVRIADPRDFPESVLGGGDAYLTPIDHHPRG